ncbi:hypothetical protein DFJ74DRAFT_651513 [Hyaloraphidium curvatum]|nr:hypothetical protein DFJ74DRAFT_651513 [Hyaloraphidium curvatum]
MRTPFWRLWPCFPNGRISLQRRNWSGSTVLARFWQATVLSWQIRTRLSLVCLPNLDPGRNASFDGLGTGFASRKTCFRMVRCVLGPRCWISRRVLVVGTLGAYKEKAARVLGMLEKLLPLLIRTNIGIAPDSAAPHPAHADLFLWAAASQLGESVWATTASRATAQAIVGKLLHVSKCPSLSELVKTLASALFGSKMRPFFRHSFAVDKRATALPGPEDLDQQPWKTERCDALAVLKWCLFRVEGQGAFDSILTHVLPPLLVVLDDFEPSNKLEGVRLLSHVLQHLSDGLLKRTGLGDVMLDALMTALTFQDQAALVQSAVETILRLVPRLETTATKEYHERLERVLADGLISGLTYAKSDSRETVKCLLEASGALCEMHGVLTVRYFKSLLDIYCEVIRKPYVALELRISACKALRSAMEACHPAVTRHRGAILSAVAEAWMESHRAGGESMQVNGEVSTLVDELRQVVVDLKGTCGQSIDPDLQVLQRVNERLYHDLAT